MPYLDSLKTLRESAGLKKTHLARLADISVGTITNIEKHYNVSQEMLMKVINALNNNYYNNTLNPQKLITEHSCFGKNIISIVEDEK